MSNSCVKVPFSIYQLREAIIYNTDEKVSSTNDKILDKIIKYIDSLEINFEHNNEPQKNVRCVFKITDEDLEKINNIYSKYSITLKHLYIIAVLEMAMEEFNP